RTLRPYATLLRVARRDLFVSYRKLGDVTLQLDKTDDALGYYQKALEVSRELARDGRNGAVAQRDVSVSYGKLGDVALKLGKTDEPLGYHKMGLEVRLQLPP